jgi:hypothetical protein
MPTRLAVILCRALLVAAVAAGGATAAGPEGGGPAVVLELFTSQGCSSCPPADRLLSRLGRDERLRGRVVTLAFHVDYFNSLGWADRFSSPDWTARQDAYARALGRDGVYTPQLVVNGRVELNGSDEAGVVREVNAAWAAAPPGRVTLEVAKDGERRLAVDVAAETPEAVDADKLDVVVFVYENGVTTPVKRGENSGRTLEEDFVVRRLTRAFSFEPAVGARQQKRVTVELDRSWAPENVGVAAVLQDPKTMRIYGAAVR